MCDPVSITGLVLSAAGTMYGMHEQKQNQKRMTKASNNAALAELDRQKGFQAEADKAFSETTKAFDPAAQSQKLMQSEAYRTQRSNDAIDSAHQYQTPTGRSTPDVVKTEMARRQGDANKSAKASGAAHAKLSGFGDLFFDNNLKLADSRTKLGTIGDFSGRSAGLLPLDQQAARTNAYKPPSGVAEGMKIAGTLMSMGAAAGLTPSSFGSLFGPSPIVGAPLAPALQPGPFTMIG